MQGQNFIEAWFPFDHFLKIFIKILFLTVSLILTYYH